MKRRDIIAIGLSAAAWPVCLRAQQRDGAVRRIGYLGLGTAVPLVLDSFRDGLRELGWVEGKSVLIHYRFAEGRYERLPLLAEELVQLKVDVIAATPTPATLAAKSATQTIPIVGIGFDEAVELGIVASLARPGGNVTGLSYSVSPAIFGKDMELLRELIPEIRVTVLSNSTGPNHEIMMDNVKIAAKSLAVEAVFLDARDPDDFDRIFEEIATERIPALFVYGDPMFSVHRARLAELAARHRLPTMYTNRLHVDAGGLMSYGPRFGDMWRRAAAYVNRILQGTKPWDLPVEQPTKFELVINMKTAKAFDISISNNLLSLADEVIE